MEKAKPKILMALNSFNIGGAETHVLELCKGLKENNYNVCVASGGGLLVGQLSKAGIKHFTLPLHTNNPISMYVSYHMLYEIIKQEHINIIHAHARIPAFLCGILQKRMDFFLVTTVHYNFKTSFPLNILSNWGDSALNGSKFTCPAPLAE